MSVAVHAFGDDQAAAGRLANALGVSLREISLHTMPDGESLPVVAGGATTALLYRALDRPDAKLMPLLLAADALRRAGASRIVLVAPYMPYLRQDKVFSAGQPLSRDVIGALLGRAFDRVVTVEPHLHRTADLTPVFLGVPVTCLTAAGLLAERIGAADAPLIVGPDAESRTWTETIAHALRADFIVLEKSRKGDRKVVVPVPPGAKVAGRRTVVVDDICSSGATLLTAARGLLVAKAASVEVAVVHALAVPAVGLALRRAGVRSIVSTDSCNRRTGAIHLAPLLAAALAAEID